MEPEHQKWCIQISSLISVQAQIPDVLEIDMYGNGGSIYVLWMWFWPWSFIPTPRYSSTSDSYVELSGWVGDQLCSVVLQHNQKTRGDFVVMPIATPTLISTPLEGICGSLEC